MFISLSLSLSLSPFFSPTPQHTSTSMTPSFLSQLQTKNHFTFPLFKIKSQCLSQPQIPMPSSSVSSSTTPPRSQVLKRPTFLSSENPQNLLFLVEPPYTRNFTLLPTPDIHKKFFFFFFFSVSFLHFSHFFCMLFFFPKLEMFKRNKRKSK